MRRLVWAFAGRIYHIVGNLMPRLNYFNYSELQHLTSVGAHILLLQQQQIYRKKRSILEANKFSFILGRITFHCVRGCSHVKDIWIFSFYFGFHICRPAALLSFVAMRRMMQAPRWECVTENYFFNASTKHMLSVLKITRRLFWAAKTHV